MLSKCCSREAAASYGLVTPGTASVAPKAKLSAFLVAPKAQRSVLLSPVPKAQRWISRVSSPVPKVQR